MYTYSYITFCHGFYAHAVLLALFPSPFPAFTSQSMDFPNPQRIGAIFAYTPISPTNNQPDNECEWCHFAH